MSTHSFVGALQWLGPPASNQIGSPLSGRTRSGRGGLSSCARRTAVHALTRKSSLELNLLPVWDWSHGVCNDLELAYRCAGVFPFVLVSLIVHNTAHGPERDEGMRFSQFVETLHFLFDTFTPENCDLFKYHSKNIKEELGESVQLDSLAEPNIALWSFLKKRAQFYKKGNKVNFCRFMAYIRANKALLPEWSATCLLAELLALEHDFLSSKAFRENILVKPSVVAAASSSGSTSAAVTQLDAKILRGCCQNAVAIAVVFLGDMAILNLVPSALETWHGLSNAACRSVGHNLDWVVSQGKGDLARHLNDIIDSLKNRETTQERGFFLFEGLTGEDEVAMLETDKQLAELMGKLTFQLLTARLKRLSYLFYGWPYRMVRILFSPDIAAATIAAFKEDHKDFEESLR